jgi:hypothetical protein
LGCLITASETIVVGSGVFSDLNGQREPGANFFGAVLGLQFSEDYRLQGDGRALTFATSLGLRYAFGRGKTTGIRFGESAAGIDDISFTSATQRIHELAINLGASVSY